MPTPRAMEAAETYLLVQGTIRGCLAAPDEIGALAAIIDHMTGLPELLKANADALVNITIALTAILGHDLHKAEQLLKAVCMDLKAAALAKHGEPQ